MNEPSNNDQNRMKVIGLMESENPHRVFIRFRDSPGRLTMDKLEFAEFIRGSRLNVRVVYRDISQTVLMGRPPDFYAGEARMTQSGKGIRFTLKNGRVFYASMSRAMDFLERRESSCPLSEVVD